eukprot:1137512-Pelagomonas_calceolata.AAC.7
MGGVEMGERPVEQGVGNREEGKGTGGQGVRADLEQAFGRADRSSNRVPAGSEHSIEPRSVGGEERAAGASLQGSSDANNSMTAASATGLEPSSWPAAHTELLATLVFDADHSGQEFDQDHSGL